MAPRDRSDGGANEADVPHFSLLLGRFMLAALSHRLGRVPPQAVRRTSYSLWSIVCLQSHVTYLFQGSGTTVWSRIRKRVGVELVKDVIMR
jgi:hypothetical protein